MKQLLLILSIALLTISNAISQNRYSEDEVNTTGEYPNDTTFLKSDMTPLNGIVYGEFGDMGEYVDGERDGLHKQWHENGQLSWEVNYKDGVKHGLRRGWHENGQLLYEVNYKDGKQDGLHKQWYDNGQLEFEQNYKDGKRDGLQKRWYENGQLRWETNFKDGEVISDKSWDEEGNLTLDETY